MNGQNTIGVVVIFLFFSDIIDIVNDQISSSDYKKDEDPRIWTSKKTNNGPLADNWRQQYIQAVKDPNNKDKKLMCAYKLCKVEFRYWGMQNKIERFIHDIGKYVYVTHEMQAFYKIVKNHIHFEPILDGRIHVGKKKYFPLSNFYVLLADGKKYVCDKIRSYA